jgi:hypothetical protein
MALFQALDAEGVRFCVLRNYQGFPASNIGNDIDLLISPSDLPRVIRVIRSIKGICVVGYAERHCVASVFLEGISQDRDSRALQIDFDLCLTWKGLPYLLTDAVLEAAIPRQAGNLSFLVPSPVHEAISSLLASLLVGGWLKEKYFPQVQRTFDSDRSEVVAALKPLFGQKLSTRLVNAVIEGNRRKLLGCVRPLRIALLLRSLWHRPLHSVLAIVRHYAGEFAFRHSSRSRETVFILASDGEGKSNIAEALMPGLQAVAAMVEKRPLWPRLPVARRSLESTPGIDCHAPSPTGSSVSMVEAVLWTVNEWLSQFAEKRNFTLIIRESYYPDLLINPQSCRYGGSKWFARLVGKFIPSPVLWILLDPADEGLPSRNTERPGGNTYRQREAYRAFVMTRKNHVILNASQPVAELTEEAYAAIIETLARRADRQLRKRFQ